MIIIENDLSRELILLYFSWGFLSAVVSYLYYQLVVDKIKQKPFQVLYGLFLSGCVGGLLAVVFDRSIAVSIIIGFVHQVLYTAILKTAKGGKLFEVIKEILVKYLTAGKT